MMVLLNKTSVKATRAQFTLSFSAAIWQRGSLPLEVFDRVPVVHEPLPSRCPPLVIETARIWLRLAHVLVRQPDFLIPCFLLLQSVTLHLLRSVPKVVPSVF